MTVYLLAHGSADPRHPEDVTEIAARLAARIHDDVHACYLEHCEPRLEDVADESGVVVPLLLSPGFHLQHDVGAAIERAGARGADLLLAAPPLLTGGAAWIRTLLAEVRRTWPDHPLVLTTAGTRDGSVLALWDETATASGVPVAHASGPGLRIADLAPDSGAVVVPLVIARGFFADQIAAQAAAAGLRVAAPAGRSDALQARLVETIAAA